MNIRVILLFICICLSMPAFSQQYSFDTLESRQVASGVWYKKLRDGSVPVNVYMVRVDLQNPAVKITTCKAMDMVKQFKDKIQLVGPVPVEPLSVMVMNNASGMYNVVAAVNGDFFTEEGRPYNIQIINGQILQQPTGSTVLGFDFNNNPFLGRVNFEGEIKLKTKITMVDSVVAINGINGFRLGDQMWLYNQYIGSEFWPDSLPRSGQNQWGPEMIIKPLDGWKVNDTLLFTINRISPLTLPDVNYRFPLYWAVLSQHRNNDDWLAKIMSVNDSIRIIMKIKDKSTGNLLNPAPWHMIGGSPQIVKNGVQQVDQGYVEEGIFIDPTKPHHSKELHARTAAGLSADKRYLYLLTVDGGNVSVSKGVTLYQLGQMMSSMGIYNVVNFNGGDAATMYVDGNIVNTPSAGAEIPVANALLVHVDASSNIFDESSIPKEFKLYQNYPNPFNPSTKINYELKITNYVEVKIYDMLGREVEKIVNKVQPAGKYTVEWNASKYSSGIYYYELRAGEFRSIKKMMLLK